LPEVARREKKPREAAGLEAEGGGGVSPPPAAAARASAGGWRRYWQTLIASRVAQADIFRFVYTYTIKDVEIHINSVT
jgi:hypothetical protein